MMIVQVYVSSEDPATETQGEKLGDFYGGVPLGYSIDFFKHDVLLPGKWVSIVDQSRKPIALAEIRVYGSKWKYFSFLKGFLKKLFYGFIFHEGGGQY